MFGEPRRIWKEKVQDYWSGQDFKVECSELLFGKKKSVRVNLVDVANFVDSLDSFLDSLARSWYLFIFSFSFSSIWVTKYNRICMKSSTNSPSL